MGQVATKQNNSESFLQLYIVFFFTLFSGQDVLWRWWKENPEAILHLWRDQGKGLDFLIYSFMLLICVCVRACTCMCMCAFICVCVSTSPIPHSIQRWFQQPAVVGMLLLFHSFMGFSSQERPKPKIPIVHFSQVQPPVIICVKMVRRNFAIFLWDETKWMWN